jgi:hypothetical protein
VGEVVILVGVIEGDHVSPKEVGPIVGDTEGTLGEPVGFGVVGDTLGPRVGTLGIVGLLVGDQLLPTEVGPILGADVLLVGVCEGALDGAVGDFVGVAEGGSIVGARVGEAVVCVGDVVGDQVSPAFVGAIDG